MKLRIRIILPPATPADWRWREYKGYAIVCGDMVDCMVVGKTAINVWAGDWKQAAAGAAGLRAVIGKVSKSQEKAA